MDASVPSPVDPRLAALVLRLGDDDIEVRCAAEEELERLGRESIAALARASKDPEVEIAARARRVLDRICGEGGAALRLGERLGFEVQAEQASRIAGTSLRSLVGYPDPRPAWEKLKNLQISVEGESVAVHASVAFQALWETIARSLELPLEGVDAVPCRGWVTFTREPEAVLPMIRRLLKASDHDFYLTAAGTLRFDRQEKVCSAVLSNPRPWRLSNLPDDRDPDRY